MAADSRPEGDRVYRENAQDHWPALSWWSRRHYIAAPFCTRILADLGAEVIKVEPPGGDPFRGWGEAKDGHSVCFSIHGRNKLSIELDLKKDRETLLKLAVRADVLAENMRSGQLERLKIGPAELHAVNPRLVIARISGYGQDGPYRDKPAFGAIGEAVGGPRHLTGHPAGVSDLPPPRRGISVSDDLAGLYAAIGLLSAVWERDAKGTGEGRVVDVNLCAEVPCSRLYDIADCATAPHFPARKAVQSLDNPLIGSTPHPGPVIRLNGEAPEDVVRWTGPAVGAHTDFGLHTLLG